MIVPKGEPVEGCVKHLGHLLKPIKQIFWLVRVNITGLLVLMFWICYEDLDEFMAIRVFLLPITTLLPSSIVSPLAKTIQGRSTLLVSLVQEHIFDPQADCLLDNKFNQFRAIEASDE